jgi:hypothetical protein
MVTANFGEATVFADIIQDWFDFLGGKPGEVVVVDCGSSAETQGIYWQMFQEKLIDKLQLIHDSSDDFGKDKGFIKEYTAGAIASKPYLLTFKTDTLPFRKGYDNWLAEAISYLDRNDVFAISGSWNLPSKHSDAWDGWYFSKFCSYNLALMKRSSFMAAAHEFANDFILSGFKGKNPAAETGQDRYFIEVAFERYMQRHQLYTLSKVEDPNWTVFHTNVHNERLRETREKYLKRQGIEKYMDSGNSLETRMPSKALHYGKPPRSLTRRLQIAAGASFLGPYWRSFKEGIARKKD